MKIRHIIAAAAVPAAAAGVLVPAASASAATTHHAALAAYRHWQPPKEAYGSVELGGGYEQYAQFLAIQQQHGFKGFVNYTNFQYAEPGSGVWAPADQAGTITFNGSYGHVLNGGLTLVAKSPDHLLFSGTGYYVGNGTISSPQYTWTIKGDVRDAKVSFKLTYNTGYTVTAKGVIAKDGSASGTAKDSLKQNLTWTMPASSFISVLHYIAPVKDVKVQPKARTAEFDFKVAPLGGIPVTVKVHAGGPAKAWAHGEGKLKDNPPLTSYPVESGSITVSH